MADEKVPLEEPTGFSQFTNTPSTAYLATNDPTAPLNPDAPPSGGSGGGTKLNPPKGYPVPTSPNEPTYEDTATLSKDYLTIWYHHEKYKQVKWILNMVAVSHVTGAYKKHWRDPFIKYIHMGVYQEILYFFLPLQCVMFFFELLVAILSVLGAGLQDSQLQVAAWAFCFIGIFVAAAAAFNFFRVQPFALKDDIPAVVLYVFSFVSLIGSFIALTNAFHQQYYQGGSACQSAGFFQRAVCIDPNCDAEPPALATSPCDRDFGLHLATPASWILAWIATLSFLPVGCLLIGKLRLVRKPVTLCHLTFHGHRSFGFPRTVKVSISTADQIFQEYQRVRSMLPFKPLDPIMNNSEPIIFKENIMGVGGFGGGFSNLMAFFPTS